MKCLPLGTVERPVESMKANDPSVKYVYADTEEDFVELCLNTPRPCVVWMRGNLNQEKIDRICEEKGVCFVNLQGNIGETICLNQQN